MIRKVVEVELPEIASGEMILEKNNVFMCFRMASWLVSQGSCKISQIKLQIK